MRDLQDKTAFVTGGASGIGRAIARSLAREGMHIVIADIDVDAAGRTSEELASGGARSIAVACDVTIKRSLEEALQVATDAFGPIHLLANNAGAFAAGRFDETSSDDWNWLLEINVLGVVNGLHAFLPHMRAHGEPAHIVNTASVAGHVATPALSVYTASKFAVVGLTESLRAELAEDPIGVSLLCPGIVRTGLIESSRRHRPERLGGRAAGPGDDVAAITANGSDPAEVGDRVVEAVKADEFYIFTHPDARRAFEVRFARILAAYPEARPDADPEQGAGRA